MITAMSALFADVEGAFVERADGVALFLTGLPALLFNQILVDGPVADARANSHAIAESVATARTRGDRFVVNLRLGRDDSLRPLMARLGLQPLSETPWIPGMALHP